MLVRSLRKPLPSHNSFLSFGHDSGQDFVFAYSRVEEKEPNEKDLNRFDTALVATSLCFIIMLNGCGRQESARGTAKQRVTIGVSLLTRTHQFYQDLEAGLKEAAKNYGYELIVTAGEFDVAKQKDQDPGFYRPKGKCDYPRAV